MAEPFPKLASLTSYYRREDQRRAIGYLIDPAGYPGLKDLTKVEPRIQLYVLPSFDPMATWTVYRDGDEYLVRRIRWQPDADLSIQGISPGLHGSDSRLAASILDERLGALEAAWPTTFAAGGTFGLDGIFYGIRHLNACSGMSSEWWGQAPPGWEPLAKWLEECVAYFEMHLPGRAALP